MFFYREIAETPKPLGAELPRIGTATAAPSEPTTGPTSTGDGPVGHLEVKNPRLREWNLLITDDNWCFFFFFKFEVQQVLSNLINFDEFWVFCFCFRKKKQSISFTASFLRGLGSLQDRTCMVQRPHRILPCIVHYLKFLHVPGSILLVSWGRLNLNLKFNTFSLTWSRRTKITSYDTLGSRFWVCLY